MAISKPTTPAPQALSGTNNGRVYLLSVVSYGVHRVDDALSLVESVTWLQVEISELFLTFQHLNAEIRRILKLLSKR